VALICETELLRDLGRRAPSAEQAPRTTDADQPLIGMGRNPDRLCERPNEVRLVEADGFGKVIKPHDFRKVLMQNRANPSDGSLLRASMP